MPRGKFLCRAEIGEFSERHEEGDGDGDCDCDDKTVEKGGFLAF